MSVCGNCGGDVEDPDHTPENCRRMAISGNIGCLLIVAIVIGGFIWLTHY